MQPTTLETLAGTLTDSLRLTQPPVAIAFTDSVPPGVRAYSGLSPAGCRFWQEAASRVFATAPRDHDLCSIGVYTHNLKTTGAVNTDLQDALKVFADLGYVRPADLPFIPVLERQPKVVVYGPLASIPVKPDVVLLFVKSDQALILSEASQQLENGLPPALGRPAPLSRRPSTPAAPPSASDAAARAPISTCSRPMSLSMPSRLGNWKLSPNASLCWLAPTAY
jgi:uncharacterized protein (DUF169 family)